MPLSWNEIRDRAIAFTREWQDETREHAEAKSFWDAFFNVFGMSRRRLAGFEVPVHIREQKLGFIDLLWKGMLLVEHKSRGHDLQSAYEQARDYFPGLKEDELPRYVLVSDFARFRLHDIDQGETVEFAIEDFHRNIKGFAFIAGYTQHTFEDEAPTNVIAAEKMGKIHDALFESGYRGHHLEQILVRLLFCLFADDTGIFERDIFGQYIRQRTNEDGADLGMHLARIFQVLNTPEDSRSANLDQDLQAFPYVNGGLFEETLAIADFNARMRETLLECSRFDWSQISPAIFGSMFQSVMDSQRRRDLGAHYTSEKNILKLIRPLFLDELEAELAQLLALKRGRKQRLDKFHDKLASLRFFDPACGCGNFLVITYRELRRLELEVLKALHQGRRETQRTITIDLLSRVNVDQMFGIEIEEFPAKIAETALWLTDHQANEELSKAFGEYFVRIPLQISPHILNANALAADWESFVPPDQLNYIISNPPFGGSRTMTATQKAELRTIAEGIRENGFLDYVTCWYIKAAQYIQRTNIKVGFVSTNSITQGEQVGILWDELLNKYHITIHFAHRTFQWHNEARGRAGVHCVIIGFSNFDVPEKSIYEYEDIKGEPHKSAAIHINPYLLDGPDVIIRNRQTPLCRVPEIAFGNMPRDGGHLILDEQQRNQLIEEYPQAEKFIRLYLGSREFIRNEKRWCLWLIDASPGELRSIPPIME